mgnify:CR=1 FL=1
MQKLNCKVGDLAIVVSATLVENIGHLVEVIGLQRGKPFRLNGSGHVWQVRTVSGRKTLHYRYRDDGTFVKLATGPVPDRRLRPVSGLTGIDTQAEEASAVKGIDALVGAVCSVA